VVPVPVRVIDCGLPVELSATEIAAVRCPAAVGLNQPLIVPFEPAATEMSQLRSGGGGHYLPKSVAQRLYLFPRQPTAARAVADPIPEKPSEPTENACDIRGEILGA
jgi:hypothetical protein